MATASSTLDTSKRKNKAATKPQIKAMVMMVASLRVMDIPSEERGIEEVEGGR